MGVAEIGTDHVASDWRKAGGNIQTMTFYVAATSRLTQHEPFETWASWRHVKNSQYDVYNPVIHDYGCAHGDGTALLKVTFPMAEVCGLDVSEEAIEQAQYRWPTLDFRVGDIREPREQVSFIYASHVLEHLVDPPAVIDNLLNYCKVLVVVVPTITPGKDGGHAGAMETTDLVKKLGDLGPFAHIGFSTLRDNVEKDGYCVVEGNNMFILKGRLE